MRVFCEPFYRALLRLYVRLYRISFIAQLMIVNTNNEERGKKTIRAALGSICSS